MQTEKAIAQHLICSNMFAINLCNHTRPVHFLKVNSWPYLAFKSNLANFKLYKGSINVAESRKNKCIVLIFCRFDIHFYTILPECKDNLMKTNLIRNFYCFL